MDQSFRIVGRSNQVVFDKELEAAMAGLLERKT
jgi:hypothetical protein